ncbi:MAG: TSUP family transporter [Ramlibacter sp.]|nr:TSUP family transporter [Ramlibacter sp.]
MSGAQVALFIAFVVVATLAQGLTGFAFVLVLLGLAGLFQLAPVTDLANVATTLAVLGAAAMLRTSLRHVDRTAYREAVAGSAPGVLAGVLLLQWLSANVMTVLGVLLGVTIFACAITMLRPGNVLPVRSSGIWFGGFGLLSGLLGGLFSAGGPPLVYHFYRQPMAMEAPAGHLGRRADHDERDADCRRPGNGTVQPACAEDDPARRPCGAGDVLAAATLSPPLATRDGAQDRVRVASRHRRQHRRLSPAGTLSPHA